MRSAGPGGGWREFTERVFPCIFTYHRLALFASGGRRAGVSMHIYVSPARPSRAGKRSSGCFHAYLRVTGPGRSSREVIDREFPCVFTYHRLSPLELGTRRAGVFLRMYVQSALLARVWNSSSGRFHAYLRITSPSGSIQEFMELSLTPEGTKNIPRYPKNIFLGLVWNFGSLEVWKFTIFECLFFFDFLFFGSLFFFSLEFWNFGSLELWRVG